VLQYHAGPGRRGKDTKRANAAGGDAVADATPLQPRSPGWSNTPEATGSKEASSRPATAIEPSGISSMSTAAAVLSLLHISSPKYEAE
jgi:hypothetical protein